MSQQYYVYIMTNRINTVLYTGVTNDLIRRVSEHKEKAVSCFTQKYNVEKLVYYEVFDNILNARERERQIKDGKRSRKIALVMSINREWKDLLGEL